MSERKHPVVRARLYEPGQRFIQRYDGFGQHDVAADLWRVEAVGCNRISPAELGVGAGLGDASPVPTAMVLDHPDLNCVICRPFLDTSQALGLEHFDLTGGSWLPLSGLGMGEEVRLYQYDGRQGERTGAVSRFTLPPNPVVCVSLYRTAPRPDHDWRVDPPGTTIELGLGSGSELSVVLPYGGSPIVKRRHGGVWERIANSGRGARFGRLEGYGPDGRLLIWFGVWRGKLVVSTDGFSEDLWVCPTGPEQVEVGAGHLGLWHNAGQWAFSVLPVKMAAVQIDSEPIETGYDTEACAGELMLNARTRPVTDGYGNVLAGVTAVDSTALRTDLSETQRSWRCLMAPHVHRVVEPAFETAVSPELYSVQIGQFPEVIDSGAAAWTDISGDVESVWGESGGDGRATAFTVELDNSLGQHADAGEYRRASLALGWLMADGTAEYESVADGYLVEPEPAVLAGPRSRMLAAVIDPMVRLRDEKCDGRAPVFDGWPVRNVFAWVLDRCGIPEALRELEDTGTVLSTGSFERPLWQAEPGRTWAEFLEEVAAFDYRAAVFFREDGMLVKACRYCRGTRTAEDVTAHDGSLSGACGSDVRWELYTRAELAAGPDTPGAVLSIERPRESLFQGDFANYVAVLGVGPDGRPVRSVIYEPASLYDAQAQVYVGWRKMEVAALETYTTQAEVNRLAQELFRERSARPEHVVVTMPLEPGVRVGQVIRVHGAETVGAGDQKYRVEQVTHRVRKDTGKVATTQVKARWLGGET